MTAPAAHDGLGPRRRAHALLVFGLAVLAHLNTIPNRPVLDDGWAIFDNPVVRDPSRMLEALRRPWGGGAAPPTVAGLWRPLTTLTFALNHAAGGRAPWGYHLVNVLLHALAALALWALARRLAAAIAPARAEAAALVAGALFSVHPVHVEAVAGLVGRAELLSTLGVLGALLALSTTSLGPWRLPAAALALALGLLSKENAAVAPALLVLAGLAAPRAFGLPARPGPSAPEARRAAAGLLGLALLLGAVVLAYGLVRPVPLLLPEEARWFAGVPRQSVLFTMTRVLADYLRLLVWPHPLGVDFAHATRFPTADALGAGGAAATAAWLGALLVGARLLLRRPVAGLGVLWIFAALLPVLNLLAPVGVLMAERLLYLPSAGFCLAAGDLLSGALAPAQAGRRARRATVVLSGLTLLLSALGMMTLRRNAEWRDGVSLWEAERAKAPDHPVVNNNLAVAYAGRGDHARALERAGAAVAAAPGCWRAHVNRGISLQALGRPDEAEGAFRAAARIEPRAPEPPFFLGILLLSRGEADRALAAFERAETLGPSSPRTQLWKATALESLGRTAAARDALERAAALDPSDREPRRRLEALR
jgi:tetratricopeptide (TPR) repeat protein